MKSLAIAATALLLAGSPASASTYTIDAVSNLFSNYQSWTSGNPLTATFNLTGFTNITSALISITAYDIDAGDGEIDPVYLNSNFVTFLSGGNDETQTVTATFKVTKLIENAINAMSIYNISPPETWGFSVSSAKLTIEATRVPGPIAGAGVPALLGLMGFAAWRRRQAA